MSVVDPDGPAARPGRGKRYHVRTVNRYAGPAPSLAEYSFYSSRHALDAFWDFVAASYRPQVQADLTDIEQSLDEVADAAEREVIQAKAHLRAAEEFFRFPPDASTRRHFQTPNAVLNLATKNHEVVLTDYGPGPKDVTLYWLKRDAFPAYYQLRQTDDSLVQTRAQILGESLEKLFKIHGVELFDPSLYASHS